MSTVPVLPGPVYQIYQIYQNWAAAVPDSARVTVFVLDVVDVVVTEIVFAALSPDTHVRDAGL